MPRSVTPLTSITRWLDLDNRLQHTRQTVTIGQKTLTLTCLDDLEQAFSQSLNAQPAQLSLQTAHQATELTPHFGVIWPSALALSQHLYRYLSHEVPDPELTAHAIQPSPLNLTLSRPNLAVELGCGLAIPSMVAADLGVPRVIATDRHPLVERFLTRNAAINHITGISYQALDWRDRRDWSQANSNSLASELRQQVSLLLGSDLLYEAWQPGFLASAIAELLAPDGVALLADPGRRHVDEFLTLCSAHGLYCRNMILDTVDFAAGMTDVLIMELAWV